MKSENEIVQSIAAQECAAAQHRSVTYFEEMCIRDRISAIG